MKYLIVNQQLIKNLKKKKYDINENIYIEKLNIEKKEEENKEQYIPNEKIEIFEQKQIDDYKTEDFLKKNG